VRSDGYMNLRHQIAQRGTPRITSPRFSTYMVVLATVRITSGLMVKPTPLHLRLASFRLVTALWVLELVVVLRGSGVG
jgi:hypothetical protein